MDETAERLARDVQVALVTLCLHPDIYKNPEFRSAVDRLQLGLSEFRRKHPYVPEPVEMAELERRYREDLRLHQTARFGEDRTDSTTDILNDYGGAVWYSFFIQYMDSEILWPLVESWVRDEIEKRVGYPVELTNMRDQHGRCGCDWKRRSES